MSFVAAGLAAALGIGYAVVSAYWAAGGTALLDTVGGSLERDARSASALVVLGLWLIVLLKLAAAALPWLVVHRRFSGGTLRRARILARVEVLILTAYGLVLTVTGLLVQSGLVHAGAHADTRALAWHAYLWDPWFLVWGLWAGLALRLAGRQPATH